MCVQRRDGVPKSLITTDQAPPVPARKREDTLYKRRHTRFAPQPSAHPLCQPTLNSLTNLNSIPPPSCTGSYRRISKRVFRGCRVPPIKAILSIPRHGSSCNWDKSRKRLSHRAKTQAINIRTLRFESLFMRVMGL